VPTEIRHTAIEDIALIHKIEEEVSICPWSTQMLEECLKIGYDCWTLVHDKLVAGFAMVAFCGKDAHILNIAVADKMHGRGFGTMLMEHIIESAKTIDSEKIILEVRKSNLVAQRLYRKLNFLHIGFRNNYYPHPDGREDALVFALTLNNSAAVC